MAPWLWRGGPSPAAPPPLPSCSVDSPELLREVARAVAAELAAGSGAEARRAPGRSPLTLALLAFALGAATVAVIVAMSLWDRYRDLVLEQSTKLTRESSPAALRRLFGGELPVWLSSPEAYGAPWINEVTKALWPYVRVAGAAWATDENGLGKLMRETTFWKPPWLSGLAIRIKAVDLGVVTPVVNGVHVHQMLPDDDRVVMDFEFSWRSKLSTLLTIMPLGETTRKKTKPRDQDRGGSASPAPTPGGASPPRSRGATPGGASPARAATPNGVAGAPSAPSRRRDAGATAGPPGAAPVGRSPSPPTPTSPGARRAGAAAAGGFTPMSAEEESAVTEETPGPRGLMWFVAHFLRIGAQISDLVVDGTIRAELRPLMNDVPVVGAVKVSLLRAPRFTYRVASLGINPMFLPGLEAMVSSFINSTVLAPMTYPEGMEIPLLPEEWANGLSVQPANDLPRGVLSVTVLRAHRVPRMDILGWADPYVALSVRDKEVFNTSVRSRTADPVWNETFHLSVIDPTVQALRLVMLEQDIMRSEEIGRVEVPLAPLIEALTADEVTGRANLSARGAPSASTPSASSGEMRSPFAFAFTNGRGGAGAGAGAGRGGGAAGAAAGFGPGAGLSAGAGLGAAASTGGANGRARTAGSSNAPVAALGTSVAARGVGSHLPNAHSASRSDAWGGERAAPGPGAAPSSPRRPRPRPVPIKLSSSSTRDSAASSGEVAAIGGSVVASASPLMGERRGQRPPAARATSQGRAARPGRGGEAPPTSKAALTSGEAAVVADGASLPPGEPAPPERGRSERSASSPLPPGVLPVVMAGGEGALFLPRGGGAAGDAGQAASQRAAPPPAPAPRLSPFASLRSAGPSVSFAADALPASAPAAPPGGRLGSIREEAAYAPTEVPRGASAAGGVGRSAASVSSSAGLSDAGRTGRSRTRSFARLGSRDGIDWKAAKTWWKEARASLNEVPWALSKTVPNGRTFRDLFRPSQEPSAPERPPEPDPIRRAEAAMHGVDFWIEVPQSRKHKVLSDDFARKFSADAEEALRSALHRAALPPGAAKEKGGLESLGRMAQEKTDHLARIFGAKSGDAVRLQLRLAYTRFDMRDLREITDEADRTPGRMLPRNSMLRNIFRGGVLQVKLDRADDLKANQLEGFVNDMCAGRWRMGGEERRDGRGEGGGGGEQERRAEERRGGKKRGEEKSSGEVFRKLEETGSGKKRRAWRGACACHRGRLAASPRAPTAFAMLSRAALRLPPRKGAPGAKRASAAASSASCPLPRASRRPAARSSHLSLRFPFVFLSRVCRVTVGSQVKKTQANGMRLVSRTSPVLDQRMEFLIQGDELDSDLTVEVELFRERFLLKDVFKGRVLVSLREVIDRGRLAGTWPMGGVNKGSLTMELIWRGHMPQLRERRNKKSRVAFSAK